MSSCIFCKIAAGDIPAALLHQDDRAVAFQDLTPQAPFHALVIPRQHMATLNDANEEDGALLGHLLLTGARLAREAGYESYRLNVNTNAQAGQSVFHVHLHVLAGRAFTWPPG